ncbi:unnamed protein product [Rangifer tarandus platyrhynchus]|uniref:Uncharacterized protein n=2 Tax=Rangifer tarandus platyrhynchus TaxID=3082113 RepID=A0ACB0EB78_RANTA|nr:unnamed protein product [Rangifer tarandus platyrhynchus]CAI9697826.1 unnamed protein product [Rangifer tarandus platyrhynchus]
MQSGLFRNPGVPCARWETARPPRSQPEKLPFVERSWGSLPGFEFRACRPRPRPVPSAAGSPLGSCRPFPSARVAGASLNPGGPCALASGLQTLTCRWSASLRVCVDTSGPL